MARIAPETSVRRPPVRSFPTAVPGPVRANHARRCLRRAIPDGVTTACTRMADRMASRRRIPREIARRRRVIARRRKIRRGDSRTNLIPSPVANRPVVIQPACFFAGKCAQIFPPVVGGPSPDRSVHECLDQFKPGRHPHHFVNIRPDVPATRSGRLRIEGHPEFTRCHIGERREGTAVHPRDVID